MSISLKVDHLQDQLIKEYGESIWKIFESVKNKTAVGSGMTEWINWVDNNKEQEEIIWKTKEIAQDWKNQGVKKIVIIGTGASYLGCRAALDFNRKTFGNKDFEFIYVPYISDRYLKDLLASLEETKFAVVVISKSGNTLETSIAFRLIRELLAKKEQNNYQKYVIAITNKSEGTLKEIASKENFHTFNIPEGIVGRFGTLTAAGLVPMVLGGIDAAKVLEGARKAKEWNFDGEISQNKASLYAAYRHFMFKNKNLVTECLISYDPQIRFTLEIIKELLAESEGKNNQGLMPVILDFTPDLHSVGQLIQEGKKSFFETTFLIVQPLSNPLKVQPSIFNNDDDLDWVAGKTLKEINNCAFSGTLDAHSNVGNINNLVVEILSWDPESFGYLYFWICLVAMYSSYLFEVNPFNQPGFEMYKAKIKNLLSK